MPLNFATCAGLHDRGMFNAFSETTYDSDYKFIKTQHPPKFHYFVSFVVNSPDKLIPRCYPNSLRIFPHRILDFERSALGFGPTGEYKRSGKRKTRSKGTRSKNKTASLRKTERKHRGKESDSESESKNSDFEEQEKSNEENLKKPALEEMKEIYKTTARLAADECALSIIRPRPAVLPEILGKNGDRELYHSVYQRNGTWKAKVAPQSWDRCQVRPLYENSKLSILGSSPLLRSQRTKKEVTGLKSGKFTERLLNRSQVTTPPDAHVRPTPGYGGFVPKLPVQSSPTRLDPRLTQSSSAATYRYYPNSTELKILEFAHKGPLSKLVTTTKPCNPFKKRSNFN